MVADDFLLKFQQGEFREELHRVEIDDAFAIQVGFDEYLVPSPALRSFHDDPQLPVEATLEIRAVFVAEQVHRNGRCVVGIQETGQFAGTHFQQAEALQEQGRPEMVFHPIVQQVMDI